MKSFNRQYFYLIADLTKENEKNFLHRVESLLDAGIDLFQLRAKGYDDDTVCFYIEKLKTIQNKYDAVFIIDDYWYLVKEFELDGVHLGKDDFPPEIARYILPDKIIGYTVNNLSGLKKENLSHIDYIGVGPAFPTKTKKNLSPVLGAKGINEIIKKTNLPYFAIGGIDNKNIMELLKNGIKHFAISSYLMKTDNPITAFELLKNQVEKFLK